MAKCDQCTLEQLHNYFTHHGFEARLVPSRYDSLLTEMLNIHGSGSLMGERAPVSHKMVPFGMHGQVNEKNKKNFAIIQRRTRMAFYQLLRMRMFDLVAEKSPPFSNNIDTTPYFTLLRRSLADEWILRSTAQLFRDMIRGREPTLATRQREISNSVAIGADTFRGLAAGARMIYAGANVEALGTETAQLYRMDSSILPFFPEEVSVRKRLVYWKWSPNGLATDIISSSADGVLLLLLEAYGFSNPSDPSIYPRAFQNMHVDCVVPFVTSTHADDAENPAAFTGFLDTAQCKLLSLLKTCPPATYTGVARPLNYDDYK